MSKGVWEKIYVLVGGIYSVYSKPKAFRKCERNAREMFSSALCEYKRKLFLSSLSYLLPPTHPLFGSAALPLFKQKYVPSNDFHLHLHNNCGCVKVFLEKFFLSAHLSSAVGGKSFSFSLLPSTEGLSFCKKRFHETWRLLSALQKQRCGWRGDGKQARLFYPTFIEAVKLFRAKWLKSSHP